MKNRLPPNHNSQPPPPDENEPDPHSSDELVTEGYKTNDRVRLSGGLGSRALRKVRVSGAPPLYLDRRQFLVLFILACHGRTLKKLLSPFPVDGGPFLSAAEILSAADRFQLQAAGGLSVLENGIPGDIARVVFELRDKFRQHDLNPNLIETGPKGTGYRLSTPAKNLKVTLIRDNEPTG